MNTQLNKTKKYDTASKRYEISSYISSVDTVTKCNANDTLGSALPLVKSSHSPLFVFDTENEFLGIISPYQALYTHKQPYTTKVSSIASKPPYMTKETQLYEVASFMLENRVYVLPLFDESKQIVGVIHAKDVFQNLIKDEDLLTLISSTIKVHEPVTASNNSSVGDIFQIMRDKNVSRVVLIDDNGLLSGIVSRKDLHRTFMKPTEKLRFGKNSNPKTDRAFDKEKEYRKDDPVKKYATENVYTLPYKTVQKKMLKQLVTSEHNSVIFIDKYKKPVGVLSMRDILTGLASLRPMKTINLLMTNPTSNVSEEDIKKAKEQLIRFSQKMYSRIAIDKIEVTFEEPKTPSGGSILFITTLVISPFAGVKIVSKTKSRSFLDSIRSAIDQIEKQERRSGKSKANSKHLKNKTNQ
ncbi:MAG: CBS domain-containing protein [Candidatus Roizmanbacteria bacterium]|nr:CBS domain-containing protein [Candidatus Roizmanbacteria bacterium]